MVELVTDRTQDHVKRLSLLSAKGWNNLTIDEKIEYEGYAAKGAYNYTDLNRVETAVSEISQTLGLSLVTKTDWNMWDVPTQIDMKRYLGNVATIRGLYPGVKMPALPSSMSGLTYEGANIIEKVLEIVREYEEGSGRMYYHCGDLFCGEV